jgi:hypothetical protein
MLEVSANAAVQNAIHRAHRARSESIFGFWTWLFKSRSSR